MADGIGETPERQFLFPYMIDGTMEWETCGRGIRLKEKNSFSLCSRRFFLKLKLCRFC